MASSVLASLTQAAVPSGTATASTASCTTAVPGKYGAVPPDACNSNYNYVPVFAPAVLVAAVFGLLTATHIAQAVAYRTRFAWVLIMGALWETLSFVLRAAGARDQQSAGLASASFLLFLLAPLWINAFVYMTLARTVYVYSPDRRVWRLPALRLSRCFVWADVATFLVQATGGIMTTPGGSSGDTARAGLDVYMAGLGCQQLSILVFALLMAVFHRAARARARDAVYAGGGQFRESPPPQGRGTGWRSLLYTLYAALVFISMRIVYRIVEYGAGTTPSNPIPYHEIYSYLLDALPMAVCLLVLAVGHPGHTLRGRDSELPRPSRREKRAARRAIKAAKKESKAQQRAAKEAGSVDMVPLQDRPVGRGGDNVEEADNAFFTTRLSA